MAQPLAPTSPRREVPFVDPRTGRLSDDGIYVMEQLWRQVAAGFVIVPVTITGKNVLTLTPVLAREGAASYGDHMAWAGPAAQTSDGAVTAVVTDGVSPLDTIKVYKTNGAAQAGAGDLVALSFYTFWYVAALDSGAGGLVLK